MLLNRLPRSLASPSSLLVVFAPLIWWGAFEADLLWVLPLLSLLLWYGRESPRAYDAAQFAFVAVGVLIAVRSGLPWFPALTLAFKFAFGGFLVLYALRTITSPGRDRSAWGLVALGALWVTAPSAVGLFTLLLCALVTGEIRQRALHHRPLVPSRGLWVVLALFAALALGGVAVQLLFPVDVQYRDPGGERSPFLGFNFGWSDGKYPQAPAWLDWIIWSGYALVALLALASLVAFVYGVWSMMRTQMETWTLRLPERPEPTLTRTFPPSPEGVRRLYERFLTLAGQAGFPRHAQETPLEFERRLHGWRPAWTEPARVLREAYEAVRYGDVPSAERFALAQDALSRLEHLVGSDARREEQTS